MSDVHISWQPNVTWPFSFFWTLSAGKQESPQLESFSELATTLAFAVDQLLFRTIWYLVEPSHTAAYAVTKSSAVEKCALSDFSRQSEARLLSKLLSWIFGGLPISALPPLAALTVSCLCKPPKLTLALTDLVNFLTIWLVETLSPKQSFIFSLQLVSCRQRLQWCSHLRRERGEWADRKSPE